MAKVIVYKRPGNSIEILRGTLPRLSGETEDAYLMRIAEKTYPGRKYSITTLNHGWNKKKPLDAFDHTFRKSWTLNENGSITIDMRLAKKIWIDVIREYRDKALRTLDFEFMMALEQGDMDGAKDIGEIKNILRDLPKTVEKETFNSLSELKSFWPTILLPAPAFVTTGEENVK